MIQARTYVEPAKGKVADYKRICDRHEAIVCVRFGLGRWTVRRVWHNQFGGGNTAWQLLPTGDESFHSTGHFTISIADWKAVVDRSENDTPAVANVPVHEWMRVGNGKPTYHDLPIAKLGDPLTLLTPYTLNPLTVVVREKRGSGFVMYYEHLTLTTKPT